MPAISVIVPVYQKEKYLSKCIESILGQSFSDLEVILIDDGSSDRSGEICDEYAATDGRVIVIHQKNQGVSAARNAGLRIAKGEYLAFVDADDWILPETYENMIGAAKSSGAQIVACGIRVWSDSGEYLRDILLQQRFYDKEQMLKELFHSPDQLGGTCCNKIFQRNAVAYASFPNGVKMCEDRMYLFQCYCSCISCVKLSESFSQVTESANSATRSRSVYPLFEIIASSRMLIKPAYKQSEALGSAATQRYLDDGIRYLRQIKILRKETKEKCTGRLMKLYCDLFGTLFSSFVSRRLPQSVINGFASEILRV